MLFFSLTRKTASCYRGSTSTSLQRSHHINAMGYVLSKLRVAHSRRPADTKQSQGFIKKDQDHGKKTQCDTLK